MRTIESPTDVESAHSRWSQAVFEGKAWAFRVQRALLDLSAGTRPRRLPVGTNLAGSPVLAEHASALWPQAQDQDALVVGKIHNLRLARMRLHGLEIPADAVFSFWMQLGRASTSRGFVPGRELREGCVVPAIGGGLCQVSNAIHDCAVRAGLEVVERHRHSRVLPGSLAEHDRDATVFWNYLDLRLRAPFAWRLEVELDATRLQVRLRGNAPKATVTHPIAVQARVRQASTGDCTSCDRRDCDSHVGPRPIRRHRSWLCFEPWPEFIAWREGEAGAGDRLIGGVGTSSPPLARLHARLRTRWALWRGQPLPKARGQGLEVAARAIACQLRSEDLHLVVEQGLLPWLWQAGELAGRRFDVLMNALPMQEIQRRLDMAAAAQPDCTSLRDFRAPAALLDAERQALVFAARWITPHAQIASLGGERSVLLDWRLPAQLHAAPTAPAGATSRVLFPASTLARKGVFELRQALRGMCVQLLLPPGAMESTDFWTGIDVRRVASIAEGVAHCDLAVLPAWVEHQPRGLLAAIAAGKPVIATPACGLPASLPWTCVAEGDADGLRGAIEGVMRIRHAAPLAT